VMYIYFIVDQLTNEDSLPHLLLTIMAMDSVPKLSGMYNYYM
jgi:hypothetical protein